MRREGETGKGRGMGLREGSKLVCEGGIRGILGRRLQRGRLLFQEDHIYLILFFFLPPRFQFSSPGPGQRPAGLAALMGEQDKGRIRAG